MNEVWKIYFIFMSTIRHPQAESGWEGWGVVWSEAGIPARKAWRLQCSGNHDIHHDDRRFMGPKASKLVSQCSRVHHRNVSQTAVHGQNATPSKLLMPMLMLSQNEHGQDIPPDTVVIQSSHEGSIKSGLAHG